MDDPEQTDAGVHWTGIAGAALYWESWGEQHAVFDIRSGDTHLIPDMTAQVLQQLNQIPCTASKLAHMLCMQSQVTCDENYVEHIEELLRQLQDMGLVEKTTT